VYGIVHGLNISRTAGLVLKVLTFICRHLQGNRLSEFGICISALEVGYENALY